MSYRDEDGQFVHTCLPLTVDTKSPHTIIGNRLMALQHYKEHGKALWIRARGAATLFYIDGHGKRRQRTWNKITLK